MNLDEYQNLQPNVTLDGIIFMTPNTHCAWRVETLYSKEPDTIEWINGMKEGCVLYDVGANMGQYSLYAAKRGIKVHAFEPESQNFSLMCKNISVNKMSNLITPWPIALSDFNGLSSFHVTQLSPGNSCNSFDDKVNYHLEEKEFAFTQGCYGVTLDEFARLYCMPDHIKIDVDGLEHRVLGGGSFKVLEVVKSVLVETNTALPDHLDMTRKLARFGLFPDVETADKARRTEGPFKGIGNVIYYRE